MSSDPDPGLEPLIVGVSLPKAVAVGVCCAAGVALCDVAISPIGPPFPSLSNIEVGCSDSISDG